MKKKYALHSGAIISRYDGEVHWVRAMDLVNLYGLKIEDNYVIWDRLKFLNRQWSDYIHLFPRDDGDYDL